MDNVSLIDSSGFDGIKDGDGDIDDIEDDDIDDSLATTCDMSGIASKKQRINTVVNGHNREFGVLRILDTFDSFPILDIPLVPIPTSTPFPNTRQSSRGFIVVVFLFICV